MKKRFIKNIALGYASLLLFFINTAQAHTYAENGMVVSDNVIASQVGIDISKEVGVVTPTPKK